MTSGKPTKHPGVYRLGHKKFRLRFKYIDRRTGKTKEVQKTLNCPNAREAARRRAELLDELSVDPGEPARRVRVGEYAQSWMKSKALKIDAGTARTYADALDTHVLPTLGDFYYDALTKRDVQSWVDESLMTVRVLKNGKRKLYSRDTVHGWYRVLRTMTRDAMDDLELGRDPTLRISFPDAVGRDERNALSPEELARFLWAVRQRYPHHFALAATLAFTGLRFCHASALQWIDWDEPRAVIRVRRKQVHGRVGKVSRKKRAPREVPVEPELAAILREHRQRMLAEQAPGLADGWMFPSSTGTLRSPSTFDKAFRDCLKAAGIKRRFTPHGLRYTFTDLVRLAKADAVVRRALTGHVTESMQDHYSSVDLDEKRAAVAGMLRLVTAADPAKRPAPRSATESGTSGGTSAQNHPEPASPENLTDRNT